MYTSEDIYKEEPKATVRNFIPLQHHDSLQKDFRKHLYDNKSVTFEGLEHGSEQWHMFRANHIGGSDTPCIYDLARHKGIGGKETVKTVQDLIDEKARRLSEFEPTRWTYWGTMMEPVIIQHYMNQSQDFVAFKKDVFVDLENPQNSASLDLLYWGEDDKFIVEIKCTSYSQRSKVKQSMAMPSLKHTDLGKYWVQCQHNMGVTKVKKALLSILVGGNELFERFIDFDEDWYEAHSAVTKTILDEIVLKRKEIEALHGSY